MKLFKVSVLSPCFVIVFCSYRITQRFVAKAHFPLLYCMCILFQTSRNWSGRLAYVGNFNIQILVSTACYYIPLDGCSKKLYLPQKNKHNFQRQIFYIPKALQERPYYALKLLIISGKLFEVEKCLWSIPVRKGCSQEAVMDHPLLGAKIARPKRDRKKIRVKNHLSLA
jgi:hypothetical protein